jgi:BirA family transcriptional regulator, biotin operon repressor / biotin---[acetyl-CoA-carboxylase] ligase
MLFPPVRFQLEVLDECGSTNELLLGRRGQAGFHGAALMARRQTAGYGRRGRSWFSAEGNLALSLGFEMPADADAVILLPFVAGLAAFAACGAWLPQKADLRLKWPNDIYLDGRKLSGLLSQARQGPQGTEVVLGIGLNLKQVPQDLAETTIALASYGEPPQPEAFAELFLRELERIFSEARDFAWLKPRWEAAARLREGRLHILGEPGSVEPLALLPSGELLVRTEVGAERRLSSEEVSLRFEPGPLF